jgi:hypothetical protein
LADFKANGYVGDPLEDSDIHRSILELVNGGGLSISHRVDLPVCWLECGIASRFSFLARAKRPLHAFLQVIERKLGRPITLCMLFYLVARALGVAIELVSYPGRFLLKFLHQPE